MPGVMKSRDRGGSPPVAGTRDRRLPSTQIANFPKNEHWRRCASDESIPCDTM